MTKEKVTCKIYKLSQAGKVYMSQFVLEYENFLGLLTMVSGVEIDRGKKILYEYEFWEGKYFDCSFKTSDFITVVYYH